MTDVSTEPGASPGNPRSRPIVSCLNCRRKKQKCDRQIPCNSCIRSGRPSSCQYAPGQEPVLGGSDGVVQDNKRRRIDERISLNEESVAVASFNDLQERVRQLERALHVQNQQIQILIDESKTKRNLQTTVESSEPAQALRQKTRELVLYKPLRSQFPDLQSFIDGLDDHGNSEELSVLARSLRGWGTFFAKEGPRTSRNFLLHDNVPDVLAHMEQLVPSERICKVLIDLYFESFEHSLRVLHPIAKTHFRAFFRGQLIEGQRTTCLPTLLAVLSMASTLGTCPECDNPALLGQQDGIGAYQLLRNYLALLTERQWRELPNLQVAVLSLKSHKNASLSPVQSWQWSGEIVRRAMAAGLHYLYSDDASVYTVEIKRRLWLTMLELDLTLAIAANMPATCPSWDHDAPLSIDDNKLYPMMGYLPQSEALDHWADGICQHVLAQSFNDRREAYALVASDKLTSHETILRHTRHLEQVIHDLPKVFKLSSPSGHESDSPYRLIAKMELDFLLRRPLNACYAVHGAEMPPNDEFKEARIPWIQGCCFSICFQDLFDPNYPMLDLPSPEGLWDFYYNCYDWDVYMFMLSQCLELQRLRSLDKDAADVASQPFQGHTLREPVRIMGWTIESITASLDQTIDPIVRRLGRHGSSFEDAVRWVAITGALRVNPTCSRLHAIKNELQEMVANLHSAHRRPETLSRSSSSISLSRTTAAEDVRWLKTVLSSHDCEDMPDDGRKIVSSRRSSDVPRNDSRHLARPMHASTHLTAH